MNHTPTPYRIDRVLTENGAPIITSDTRWGERPRVIAKVMYHGGSEDPEVEANAEFIVRACNVYDRMLKLCRDLLRVAQDGDYTNGVEEFGIDEGRVRTFEHLKRLEAELKELEND